MEELTPLEEKALNACCEALQLCDAEGSPQYIRMTCEQRSLLRAGVLKKHWVFTDLKKPPSFYLFPVVLVNSHKDYWYREHHPNIPNIDLSKD